MSLCHVQQPTRTSCAQACIAMVTGADVHELIAKMRPGPITGTRGGAIVRELKARGIRCDDRFRSVRGRPIPHYALVRIIHSNKRGHVVVKLGRQWFDPLFAEPFTGEPPITTKEWTPGSRITSALWINDGMPQ